VVSSDAIEVGRPSLLTSKQGYVNQPAFTADGGGVYFTWRPEGSQADIWFHDLRTRQERPVTCTSEEEYLASPTPDRQGLTVVRVDRDLGRTVAVLGFDGKPRQTLFPRLTTVGAYRWADDHTMAMLLFAPDAPSRIVLGDVSTGAIDSVAEQVGASLAAIPGARAISYVDNSDEHAQLMRLDLASRATAKLLTLPDGVDGVAWLADGSMLAGSGTQILRASPAAPPWQKVGDLAGQIRGTIARLVVSDDQRRVAIVVRSGD
jgi:Tol biopolymer transport system component